MSSMRELWRTKTDGELAEAVDKLSEYSTEAQMVIREELTLRGKRQPSVDAAQDTSLEPVKQLPHKIAIIDFDMPFVSMVRFMIKWTLASIPAFIMLLAFFYFVVNVVGFRH